MGAPFGGAPEEGFSRAIGRKSPLCRQGLGVERAIDPQPAGPYTARRASA
jgi:hypothetical protein